MSRYGIITDDENLEIFVGFDEGFEGFFLTVLDIRDGGTETANYLFHNMEHHPGVKMSFADVETILEQFGIRLPADLATRLSADTRRSETVPSVSGARNVGSLPTLAVRNPEKTLHTGAQPIIVLDWSAI